MIREVVITADGSSTIHLPEWDEQYHSKHGAIQEAYHVFIKSGLNHMLSLKRNDNYKNDTKISILEIGFGTGLNAFITFLETEVLNINVNYTGVEGYPVALSEIEKLNYADQLTHNEKSNVFKSLHELSWEHQHDVSRSFSLLKKELFFNEIDTKNEYDLIYFDAFGARVQPELWTEAIFQKMYNALTTNGVLVTYSAKGSVRRAMQAVGFNVERLPGPPGKREMLRATKVVLV